jgi:S-adenosylmethionine synthetase
VFVETFGTGQIPDDEISKLVEEVFDLRPGAIIRDLMLRQPIYRSVASYGHFGREDLDLPWEQLSRLDELKEAAGVKTATA